jgi:hypothetical protein
LIMIEKNARKIFLKFARNIIRRSAISPEKRKAGIQIFKWYLIFALFLLSPFVSIIFTITGILFYPVTSKQLHYYQGVLLKS